MKQVSTAPGEMGNIVMFPVGAARTARTSKPQAQSSLTIGENARLRKKRQKVWQMAGAATRYWEARSDFEDAVYLSQLRGIPEGRSHPSVDPCGLGTTVRRWRQSLVEQLLTPAWDLTSVKWKRVTLAKGQHRFTDVSSERIERAIADDLAFLAAHPVRQSRRQSNGGT
jgi:hypothetical protein